MRVMRESCIWVFLHCLHLACKVRKVTIPMAAFHCFVFTYVESIVVEELEEWLDVL